MAIPAIDNVMAYAVHQWMSSKYTESDCPDCRSSRIQIGPLIALPSIRLTGSKAPVLAEDASHQLTLVPFVCLDCARVRFYSADIMGLV